MWTCASNHFMLSTCNNDVGRRPSLPNLAGKEFRQLNEVLVLCLLSTELFLPFLSTPSPYKGHKPKCVAGQTAFLPLEFQRALGALSALKAESCRRRGTNTCSAVTNDHNFHPQELLSHSTDRPERQQLKEALEAMQVGATHTAFGQRLFA